MLLSLMVANHRSNDAMFAMYCSSLIQKLCGPSEYPTDNADNLQIIWTVLRSSGHFSDHPDTFQIIPTLFRSSRHFSDRPDTFWIIWSPGLTLFLSSDHFADHPNTFRSSGHFPDYLDTQQTIRRFSILSNYSSDHLDFSG